MGFFKKLFKGKFKKLGRGIKKIARGKFLGKLVKTAGSLVSFLPIPASGLIGKGFSLVAKIGQKKGGKMAAKLFKAFVPRGGRRSPGQLPTRQRALPAINKPLSGLQRRVLGQPSFITPRPRVAAGPGGPRDFSFGAGRGLAKRPFRKRSPRSIEALIKTAKPRRSPRAVARPRPIFVPRNKLPNLNVGTSTAKPKEPGDELSTGNKIAIAGVGLSVVTTILIAALKK